MHSAMEKTQMKHQYDWTNERSIHNASPLIGGY